MPPTSLDTATVPCTFILEIFPISLQFVYENVVSRWSGREEGVRVGGHQQEYVEKGCGLSANNRVGVEIALAENLEGQILAVLHRLRIAEYGFAQVVHHHLQDRI